MRKELMMEVEAPQSHRLGKPRDCPASRVGVQNKFVRTFSNQALNLTPR